MSHGKDRLWVRASTPEQPLTIYLAAPYAARAVMSGMVRPSLERRGARVLSSWHEETHDLTGEALGPAPVLTDEQAEQAARTCVREVDASEVLILFTGKWLLDNGLVASLDQTTSGGRHIETGIAIARYRPVLVIGEPENIFHRARLCVPTWADALAALPLHFKEASQ